MAARTYLPIIIQLTKKLCQIILLATPVIQRLYPDNTTLQNALSTANSACALLNSEALLQRPTGD